MSQQAPSPTHFFRMMERVYLLSDVLFSYWVAPGSEASSAAGNSPAFTEG